MLTIDDKKSISEIVSASIKPLAKDIQVLKNDLRKTNKELKLVVNYFDSQLIKHRESIRKIERHLGFSATV